MPASAKAIVHRDGRLVIHSATADIGTGTYTIMTQIGADCLGLSIDSVTFELGDSSMPSAPLEGGSWTAGSVGSAVNGVCDALGEKLYKLARAVKDSPFSAAKFDDIVFGQGRIYLKPDPARGFTLGEVLAASDKEFIERRDTFGSISGSFPQSRREKAIRQAGPPSFGANILIALGCLLAATTTPCTDLDNQTDIPSFRRRWMRESSGNVGKRISASPSLRITSPIFSSFARAAAGIARTVSSSINKRVPRGHGNGTPGGWEASFPSSAGCRPKKFLRLESMTLI